MPINVGNIRHASGITHPGLWGHPETRAVNSESRTDE